MKVLRQERRELFIWSQLRDHKCLPIIKREGLHHLIDERSDLDDKQQNSERLRLLWEIGPGHLRLYLHSQEFASVILESDDLLNARVSWRWFSGGFLDLASHFTQAFESGETSVIIEGCKKGGLQMDVRVNTLVNAIEKNSTMWRYGIADSDIVHRTIWNWSIRDSRWRVCDGTHRAIVMAAAYLLNSEREWPVLKGLVCSRKLPELQWVD